jgi:glutamine amidotransferase
MTQVVIVDSGGANIASVQYALERLGATGTLTTNPDEIRAAKRVLLPGVGAAKDAMQKLRDAKLVDVIRSLKQPVLGICLGMQLLCDGSEEENVECLGIIPGTAKKLTVAEDFPVPNMGWCATQILGPHALLAGLANDSYFYYVHSYALPVTDVTLATAKHSREFSALIGKENFVAAQFHPERSSANGARLLRNFLELPS